LHDKALAIGKQAALDRHAATVRGRRPVRVRLERPATSCRDRQPAGTRGRCRPTGVGDPARTG
jgi:hypothetical protein